MDSYSVVSQTHNYLVEMFFCPVCGDSEIREVDDWDTTELYIEDDENV